MKASELRIGNWVAYNGENGKSELPVFAQDICNCEESEDDKSWEPIPLTEVWLERFGFNSKYKSVHVHWNYFGFGIDQKSDVDDHHNSIPQEQVFYYFPANIEVKYVHQLQNLYHAITEKELTIKTN